MIDILLYVCYNKLVNQKKRGFIYGKVAERRDSKQYGFTS